MQAIDRKIFAIRVITACLVYFFIGYGLNFLGAAAPGLWSQGWCGANCGPISAAALGRINDWDLVIIPLFAVVMLIVSAKI